MNSWDWKDFAIEADLLQLNIGKCEGECQRPNMARSEQGPRAYTESGPIMLCSCCAESYHSYWDDMWSDYYRGLL